MDYRRLYTAGGCYFFTVVTHNRRPILTDPYTIQRLRNAFTRVRTTRPFEIDAIVILPDHLHCIWRLPEHDRDFSTRWMLIKKHVALGLNRENPGKRQLVWQQRFWEHLIRDEADWRRHLDYIHYNPVKHGYVANPSDWPHSSFRRSVERGWYDLDWGRSIPESIKALDYE